MKRSNYNSRAIELLHVVITINIHLRKYCIVLKHEHNYDSQIIFSFDAFIESGNASLTCS